MRRCSMPRALGSFAVVSALLSLPVVFGGQVVTGSLQSDGNTTEYLPLAPWLQDLDATALPPCVVLEGFKR